MFFGKPENNTGWTAGTSAIIPDDTRGVLSTSPFYFPAGGNLTLDVALAYGRDINGNNKTSVGILRTNTQLAKTLYDMETFCSMLTGINSEYQKIESPSLYPNPSNGTFFIANGNKVNSIEVYNIIGNKILTINNLSSNEINLSNTPTGIYFVKMYSEEKIYTNKIIIE